MSHNLSMLVQAQPGYLLTKAPDRVAKRGDNGAMAPLPRSSPRFATIPRLNRLRGQAHLATNYDLAHLRTACSAL